MLAVIATQRARRQTSEGVLTRDDEIGLPKKPADATEEESTGHDNIADTEEALRWNSFRIQVQVLFTPSRFRTALNIFFGLVPAGFVLYYCHANVLAIFFINFFAILPSASVQSFAADELGLLLRDRLSGWMGDTLAALLNSTFKYVTCLNIAA